MPIHKFLEEVRTTIRSFYINLIYSLPLAFGVFVVGSFWLLDGNILSNTLASGLATALIAAPLTAIHLLAAMPLGAIEALKIIQSALFVYIPITQTEEPFIQTVAGVHSLKVAKTVSNHDAAKKKRPAFLEPIFSPRHGAYTLYPQTQSLLFYG